MQWKSAMNLGAYTMLFLIGVASWIVAENVHDAMLVPWLTPRVIHIVGSGLVAGGLWGLFRLFRRPSG